MGFNLPPPRGVVVEAFAGLTGVDGATLISDRHELLAFGGKIGRPEGRPRPPGRRFTLFAWRSQEGMVHAHRVERLLL